jgi:hypothetical protein
VSDRHDRYALADATAQLRATLAKAERKLPLSQPVRSWDLYADAIAEIDALTARMQARINDAHATAP